MKTYLAEKAQLDAQNVILGEINEKIEPENLESVRDGILDFVNDDITIVSGGLNSIGRIITT
jgi:hypothetical protein